jgi:hypothetical protein
LAPVSGSKKYRLVRIDGEVEAAAGSSLRRRPSVVPRPRLQPLAHLRVLDRRRIERADHVRVRAELFNDRHVYLDARERGVAKEAS